MKKHFLALGIAFATLTPSIATAQDDGCKRDGSGRIIGTAVGAGAGGVLGGVIAGRGDRTEGAIIGGVIGAIVGNQVSKSDLGDCRTAYGYYDQNGRWHATGVSTNEARGYYDRNGKWVEGAPNGYYDNGRWVKTAGNYNDNGYTDSDGHWVPASANGYYDRNDRWIAGTSNGYYDAQGRWVAGPVRGRYDSRGRWIAGDPGYSETNGSWSSTEQPGYYENGRWREGRAYGYYDARGRWVSVRNNGNSNNSRYDDDRGDNFAGADGRYNMNQMPTDVPTRISWLREYVQSGESARRINRTEARFARSELSAISREYRMYERDGSFTQREQRTVDKRLDRLTRRLDRNWQQARVN